jgi:cytosine/adenosine deaminase-related metal-dependent hydrolase
MLIKNALIVTMDKDKRLIKNGDILIEGNKIVKIGKNIEAKEDLLGRK